MPKLQQSTKYFRGAQQALGSNAGSNPVQANCPHCREQFGMPDDRVVCTAGRPIHPGDFTVCLKCREIIRFDKHLALQELSEHDWWELVRQKELFIAMLQWRLHLLVEELKAAQREQTSTHGFGIPGSR
jgi:hypothetical protein